MELHEIIEVNRDDIVDVLFEELRSSSRHRRAEIAELRRSCERLVAELGRAVRTTPHTFGDFLCALAAERMTAGGNGLDELQLALNVLEHEIWRRIALVAEEKPLLLELLGLATGTIGSAKDRLAHCYLVAWHEAQTRAARPSKR